MGLIARGFSSLAEVTLRHPVKVASVTIVFAVFASVAVGYSWGADQFSRMGFIPTLVGILTFGGTLEKMVSRAQKTFIMAANGEAPFPYNSENITRVFTMETVLVVYGTIHSTYGDKIWGSFVC